MKHKPVRRLVLRNYISSAVASFVVFTLLVVLFGFDLEDQIFDYQIRSSADSLAANPTALEASGEVGAVKIKYYVGTDEMPDWLVSLIDPSWRPAAYEIFAEELGHFHLMVRDVGDEKLYVLLNAKPYIRSIPMLKTYLSIIAVFAGLVFLISLFFVYRMTKRVSVPLEANAAKLTEGEGLGGASELEDGGLLELKALVQAIEQRDNRIQSLLERERQFNRDASHELRTPLAVATGAAELVEQTGVEGQAFHRLKTALTDMQHLTEGILWLSRDPDAGSGCVARAVSEQAVEAYRHLTRGRPVDVQVQEVGADIRMPVPVAVAQVMVGNLVRNAFSYTDEGKVMIQIKAGEMSVFDTGVGFGNADKERTGFGVGLSLVERLCDHFGLILEVKANEAVGTEATISWGNQK